MFNNNDFPPAYKPKMVGKYALDTFSGGGYVYDRVLEYRVWYKENDNLYCFSCPALAEARKFLKHNLVEQDEYIKDENNGSLRLVHKKRVTE